jgi:hypothetical protein
MLKQTPYGQSRKRLIDYLTLNFNFRNSSYVASMNMGSSITLLLLNMRN